jgi:hypothetical protein
LTTGGRAAIGDPRNPIGTAPGHSLDAPAILLPLIEDSAI